MVLSNSQKQKRYRFRPRERGSSLVEALVTVVLLGISLLGMAMLHAQSFKLSTGSYARSQANLMAFEIMDRMRAAAVDPSAPAISGYTTANPGGSCTYTGTVASDAQITNDLNCWYTKLGTTLPGASASITQSGNLFTITINWTEQSIREDSGNQKLVAFTFEPSTIGAALAI